MSFGTEKRPITLGEIFLFKFAQKGTYTHKQYI